MAVLGFITEYSFVDLQAKVSGYDLSNLLDGNVSGKSAFDGRNLRDVQLLCKCRSNDAQDEASLLGLGDVLRMC